MSAPKTRKQTPKSQKGTVAGKAPAPLVPFDADAFLSKLGPGRSTVEYRKNQAVFTQGDEADAIFFLRKGKVKLTVLSAQGKEAVLAILDDGAFFGEGCLIGRPLWMATATTLTPCTIVRLEKVAMLSVLHDEPTFSERFITHLIARNLRTEEDLVDQLFNSAEKRLARVLLLLANFGKEGKPEAVIAQLSQGTLAEMVGTTRSRVSFFMNRFRKLGFIDYNGGLEVHSSLLTVLLRD